MPLASVGSVCILHLSLFDVYYVPKLTMNLVSMSQLCETGYSIPFSSTSCEVQDLQTKRLIGIGCKQGGLYVLDELRVLDVVASGVDLSSFRLSSSSSPFYL